VTGRSAVAGRWFRPASVLTGRVVAATLLALMPLLPAAGVPAAIEVDPDHVEPGARDVTLVFRLTDADADRPATGFRLLLPTGRPLVGVTAATPPGWAAQLTTTLLPVPAPSADGPVREAVSAVEWTATTPRTSGAMEFALHVDLMPEGAGPVRIRAVCVDRAGHKVEWADSWTEGDARPAHQALTLALTTATRTPAMTPLGIAESAGMLLLAAAALTTALTLWSKRVMEP
jgi:hypothetical protein